MTEPIVVNKSLELFITRWTSSDGGQECANYALFLTELCDILDVPRPEPASKEATTNVYAFERGVTFRSPDGSTSIGRIDLYKRGCFVLEAKQTQHKKRYNAPSKQPDLLIVDPNEPSQRGKRTSTRGWDVVMLGARQQAEQYAKALPSSEGWSPFLIVADIGHCFEIYADFTGQGKNYAQFPDRQGFRIYLEDLRHEATRERLRLIWLAPHKLDSTTIAANATRDVATRLSKVSKYLEEQTNHQGAKLYDPEKVALFLMRCLFTMFAEDIELLPKNSFRELLKKCIQKPQNFKPQVGQLWEAMDTGGFAHALELDVNKFNGYLFKDRTVLPLPREEIGELYEAAKADWKLVEPAIFGTLLEQALDSVERRKLGAHYTPRTYVERLVIATIMEPLQLEWSTVKSVAENQHSSGNTKDAISSIQVFHKKLCELRVLDPACGTGNFLYVSLELMKRLEGEVLEALSALSKQTKFTGYELKTIDPHQFLGLEVNPRAAAIAELVIWIGYLQWHFRTLGGVPADPILKDFKTIKVGDAVLDWSAAEFARDENAKPLTQTNSDGKTVEVMVYKNPKSPDWPVAEYIVGNPPFVGGKNIRGRMGEGYAKALWSAHPKMNESADFVMYWWDKAAQILTKKGSKLQRFGFITTNSLTQVFQRRVMEKYLKAKKPISLLMAIPDHPWTKVTPDAAGVRIAMTVAIAGKVDGKLCKVINEQKLDTDEPEIEVSETRGVINSDLSVGADVTTLPVLQSNIYLASRGVALHGKGFIINKSQAKLFGINKKDGTEQHIRHYRHGRDLVGISRNLMVIDFDGISSNVVRSQYPKIYQYLLETIKPVRDKNNEPYRRENWWLFGRRNSDLRSMLNELRRYIVTVETAKHRIFQFLDASILPDNKLVCIGSSDAFYLGILSSHIHLCWALQSGGQLGKGPVYVKSRCFDPFPFPDASDALKTKIRATAEEIDALRKQCQEDHPSLTLTQIYNVLEKIRAGIMPTAVIARNEAIQNLDIKKSGLPRFARNDDGDKNWTKEDQRIYEDGLVLILKEHHDTLDKLVAEAYGWPVDLSDDEILSRLVALNAERAKEEERGQIRWLRPDYQLTCAGLADAQAMNEADAQITAPLIIEAGKIQKPTFPSSDLDRGLVISHALQQAITPLSARDIAGQFSQGARVEPAIAKVLASMERLAQIYTNDGVNFVCLRSG
jgi:hypothetical protein